MKLTLHILQKDMKQLRTPLLVWVGLLLLPILLGLAGHWVPGPNVQLRTVLLQLCFYDSWFQQFFLVALVGLLIQEEPLVGTTAFWMTRPLSAGMLMRAKALFIALWMVLAPLAAEVLYLALQGVTKGDIRLAVPEILLAQMGLVVLAALAAVVTPNFGRFAPVALLICSLKWLADYFPVLWNYLARNSDEIAQQLDLIDSRWVVGGLLTVLLGTLLIAHQYQTQRTGRTILWALACLATVAGVERHWDLNFLEPFEYEDEINVHSHLYGSLSLGKYEALPFPETRAERKPSVVVLGQLKIADVTPRYELRFIGTKSSSRYIGENYFVLKNGWLAKFQGFDADTKFRWRTDPQPSAVQAALDGPLVMNSKEREIQPVPFLILDPEFYQKYRDQVEGFQTALRFQLIEYLKEAELPLAVGSGFKDGSRSVTVLEVSPQIHGVNVKIQDQATYLLFKKDLKIAPSVLDPDDVVYALVNEKRKQAFLPEPRSRQWEGDLLQAEQPLRVDRQVLKFVGTEGPHGALLDQAWLKDAVLVRLKADVMGTYVTLMKEDSFSLKGNGGNFQVPWAGSLTYSLGIPLREQ